MTSLIRIPFADSGDKTAVPETDAGGGVNMTQGYGQAYSLDPATDPSAKRIEREKMNGLFNLITSAISEIQAVGVGLFISADDNAGVPYSYGKGAIAFLGGVVYQSLFDANTDTPPSSKWGVISSTGNLLNVKLITSSGTYNPTAGTKMIRVRAVGGGGGGGGVPSSSSATQAITLGGESGVYAEIIQALSSPSSMPVVIGAGGTGGAAGANAGNAGGTTSLGSVLSCPGGNGSSAGATSTTSAVTTPASSLKVPTTTGTLINSLPSNRPGGGVGIVSQAASGAAGGSNPLGVGGAGGTSANGNRSEAVSGNGYGSGGGGAAAVLGGTLMAGGNGSSGVMIIEEYS